MKALKASFGNYRRPNKTNDFVKGQSLCKFETVVC